MPAGRDEIYWGEKPQPQWDDYLRKYYFQGYKLSSGKTTKRYLKDHEIDENGYPLPDLNPASSAGYAQATPRTAPGASGYGVDVGQAGGQLDTHLTNSQETGQHSSLPGADSSSAQFFSQEYTHQGVGSSISGHSQHDQIQTPATLTSYSAGGPTSSETGLETTASLHHEIGAPEETSYGRQTQNEHSMSAKGKTVMSPFSSVPNNPVAGHQHHSRGSGGQRHRSSRDKRGHQNVPRESHHTAFSGPASSQYAHYQNSDQPIQQYQHGDVQNSGEPRLYNTGSAVGDQPALNYNTHSGQNLGWSSNASTAANVAQSQYATQGFSHAAYGGLPPDGLSMKTGGQHSEITDAAPQNVPLTALQRVINPERPEHIASDRRSGARGGLDPNVLDPNFRIYASKHFRPGRIFKVLWSEPKGSGGRGQPLNSQLSRIDSFQMADARKAFWIGFRRFIILRNNQGHCNCVPIYSYQGQGCAKPGVKPAHHGIVYENSPKNQPLLLVGEPALGFSPIRATTTSGDPLTLASRVNYAKVVTVEHNVKVLFVGDVVAEDRRILDNAVRESLGFGT